MLSFLAKALLGTAAVAGVGAAIVILDEKEEKEAAKEVENVGTVVPFNTEENPSVFKRIKRYVKKKVIKFLAFVALHMEQIEAASAVIGLGSAVIGIASAVREYVKGCDMQRQLNEIERKVDSLTTAYDNNIDIDNKRFDQTNSWMFRNFQIINDNIKLVGEQINDR